MNRPLLAQAFVLILLVNITSADDKPVAGDLAKLQGTWTVNAARQKNVQVVWTIKGNTLAFDSTTPDGRKFGGNCKIEIDEQAKPHKTMDASNFTHYGSGRGSDHLICIYEIVDNNTFRVCSSPDNRPSEFTDGGRGGPPGLFTLTRTTEPEKSASAPGAAGAGTNVALAQAPAAAAQERPFFRRSRISRWLPQLMPPWVALEMVPVFRKNSERKSSPTLRRRSSRQSWIGASRRCSRPDARVRIGPQLQAARVVVFNGDDSAALLGETFTPGFQRENASEQDSTPGRGFARV